MIKIFDLFDLKDPSGCSLIIQFLYHANMTEQMFNSGAAQPQQQQPQPVTAQQLPVVSEASPLTSPTASPLATVPISATTTTAINAAQQELKTKRIKVLRILAIKTAAILDWNLIKFEAEYNFKLR